MNRKSLKSLLLLPAAMLVFAACSTTSRLPEGEVLYTGVKKIDISGPQGEKVPESVRSQLNGAVSVPPNNAILKSPKYRWPFPLEIGRAHV